MKNAFLFLIAVFALFFSSCSDDAEAGEEAISFENNTESISFGKDTILSLNFRHDYLESGNYEWTLSKTGIVSVELDNKRIKVKGLKVGETELTIKEKDGTLSEKCKLNVSIESIKKCVVFGNSMTKHAITPYWWGEWGMAASVREKDFVHVLDGLLEEKYGNPIDFEGVNIADWEVDATSFDKSRIDEYLSGDEDVVVIRLGENVQGNTLTSYKEELSALVEYIKLESPRACFVITGNFWTNKEKDKIQKEVAYEYGCMWTILDQFDTNANKSSLSANVFGDDGAWHLISDGGSTAGAVASHPGDLGMENIAKTIFSVLTEGE